MSFCSNLPRSAAALFLTSAVITSLAAPAARAQGYLGNISTAGQGQNLGYPFGLNFGPDGYLYVCLAGTSTFGNPNFFNNNVVLKINPANQQIVNTITVGLFPEEIVFASPNGGPAVGIITNSTDGTVSILDVANSNIVATVTLPTGFFGAFPFGIALNATETIAYISGGDGTNSLRAIDLDPQSGTAYQYLSNLDISLASGAGGRLARVGDCILVPTTAYTQTFSGSTAFIERAPLPGSSRAAGSVVIGADVTFTRYPSAQDIAIAPDGIAYVCGYDLNKRIYGYNAATGALVRSFPAPTQFGAHTGLAVSPDGKVLVVCDVAANEVAFIDIARGTTIAITNTASVGFGYFGPNDAVFSPDGSSVYVTTQFSENIVRLAAPTAPTPFSAPLGFTVAPTNPALGGGVTLSTIGAGVGEFVAIVADDYDVAIDLGAFGILHFTDNATVVATGLDADVSISVTAPNDPLLFGKNFLCQALAYDLNNGIVRLSDEIPVVLQ